MIFNKTSKIVLALCVLLLSNGIAYAIRPKINIGHKYTNADFYKDSVFQKDVAKKAIRQFILQQGEIYTEKMDSLLWVSDFGLGDYEHVGLASVTWLNDSDYGYFAMTMYMAELHQHIGEIFHRCYSDRNMICEEKVTEHMLAFIFSGEMIVYNSSKKVIIRAGEAAFIRKNHLVHKIKQPIGTTPFSGVFLHLDSRLMKQIATLIIIPNIEVDEKIGGQLYIPIEKNDFISGYFRSLDKYFTEGNTPSRELMKVKLLEMLIILLEQKPQLVPMLFDYTTTWRTDLMEFMNENYLSELSIEEFAHYSGRSLSSFKREFAELSGGDTPARWIMRKRLDAAMTMLRKGISASEVYVQVGFKNLSHFSTAFKKHFGITPSQILNTV